jgi:hypothetical protein
MSDLVTTYLGAISLVPEALFGASRCSPAVLRWFSVTLRLDDIFLYEVLRTSTGTVTFTGVGTVGGVTPLKWALKGTIISDYAVTCFVSDRHDSSIN